MANVLTLTLTLTLTHCPEENADTPFSSFSPTHSPTFTHSLAHSHLGNATHTHTLTHSLTHTAAAVLWLPLSFRAGNKKKEAPNTVIFDIQQAAERIALSLSLPCSHFPFCPFVYCPGSSSFCFHFHFCLFFSSHFFYFFFFFWYNQAGVGCSLTFVLSLATAPRLIILPAKFTLLSPAFSLISSVPSMPLCVHNITTFVARHLNDCRTHVSKREERTHTHTCTHTRKAENRKSINFQSFIIQETPS